MKPWIVPISAAACTALAGCGQPEPEGLQQGDNMQYFFSREVTEAKDEYLRIEVDDIGNSNLLEGDTLGISTDVAAVDGCPEFTVGEYAQVVLARNIKDSAVRLEALSIGIPRHTKSAGEAFSRFRLRRSPLLIPTDCQTLQRNGCAPPVRPYLHHIYPPEQRP